MLFYCQVFMQLAVGLHKVMAMGLHNAFFALTGQGLSQFVPSVQLLAEGRKSVTGIDLPPWKERNFVKSVMDEEATGFKAINFLAGPCGLRIYPEPEASHPMWNDFLRAVTESSLKGILLKGTLLCNWGRGPFGSHGHHQRLSGAATDLMERKCHDEQFMIQMSELLAKDRGMMEYDDVITADEWCAVCEKTIPKARTKAWFQIRASFTEMERSWTIFRVTVDHMGKFKALLLSETQTRMES